MTDPQGHAKHPGHGNSPAAWTTVAIIIIGSVIAGAAVVTGEWWLFVASGVGLPVLGLLIGKIMSSLGLGGSAQRRHSRAEVDAAAASESGESVTTS
ncbi:MAG TPA: HGxxPAAW family protein [Actinopolymorphaceae bacterium]|nr:HGxxPAAW family protein [Actinopolymorphaceae bacterium]